ncbi:Inositol-phosphate phosphatase [Alteripontixanthobacter maritimus]|uniref:Inositol-phosphate phosphatase n=1 Tax=Alteripontixanthobacter maritimus TaxID=2161824 RepID=A0A369Q8S5_9SPHN|nr:inositol monophosphatase [Alteripontixanthobacter maritimus]RDC59667.1 Inositol-phosphate phosphatase [Alteripontixanthobacter maritimus]
MSALDDEILGLMRFAAERSIMPRWRNLADGEVEEKAKDDLVTIADRETEEFLTEALTRLQPDVAVVGEEAAHEDPSVMERLSDPCWIIDPIDGTSNFASGKGHFAIMIALADAGEAVAGWIYDPQRDRFLSARKDAGAFVNGDRITVNSTGETPPSLSAMRRFMSDRQREIFARDIDPVYRAASAPGCAAEEYPLVAIGDHDLAIYERTLPWDHAAGCLFLNEAGGTCLRLDGSPYRVDDGRKGMIAAASRHLFDDLAARLSASGYA